MIVESPKRSPLAGWQIACWMASWCSVAGLDGEAEGYLLDLLSIVMIDKPQWNPA